MEAVADPDERRLAVVVATNQHPFDNTAQDETIVITTYEPDPNEWEADYKTRRKH